MKIIAFTQIPKLLDIFYNQNEIIEYFTDNHFNDNNPKMQINIDNNDSVILVFDELDISENTELIASIKEPTNIVIKHTNMNTSIINATNNIGISAMHDEYDERNKPYKLIIDFLLSQRDAPAFTILKNALENDFLQSELKKKLQLLHDIYEKKTKVVADSSIQEEAKGALGIFNNSITIPYDNTKEDHRKALIVLRDALLAEY